MSEPTVAELCGVHFGMDDEAYFRIPALSASGVKRMLISSMDFWSDSWMNADRPADDDTVFKALGRAYDIRITKGRDAFNSMYAPALDKADHPDALVTVDDIKAVLKEAGVSCAGNKPELIDRLREVRPSMEVWDALKADHAAMHAGKELLPFSTIQRIETAAKMIDLDPHLRLCFQGGYSQVVVVWTDRETGVPMKCKFDYLKPRAIVDLKTFSNPMGKSIERAIYSAMANQKYHIQAANYSDGAAWAAAHIKAGRVFGSANEAWLSKFAEADERQFVFVFQQTGAAPVTRGYVLRDGSTMATGRATIRMACDRFNACLEKYGTDPWLDIQPIETFDDQMFSPWMFD